MGEFVISKNTLDMMDKAVENIKRTKKMRESLKAFIDNIPENPVSCVEVGVMAGANAQIIHDEICKNTFLERLVLLDLWSTDYRPEMEDRLLEVMKRFEGIENVEIIRQDTFSYAESVLNGSFDYVYLDDAHSYEHVKKEIESWYPKIRKDGMLAGHDINIKAPDRVLKAVREFAQENNLVYTVRDNYNEAVGDWWIWKK